MNHLSVDSQAFWRYNNDIAKTESQMQMRTQVEGVTLESNGKWSVTFTSYKGVPGDEYVCSEVTSGAVFATEDEAYAGATRALDVLESTGVYPNMCKKF